MRGELEGGEGALVWVGGRVEHIGQIDDFAYLVGIAIQDDEGGVGGND